MIADVCLLIWCSAGRYRRTVRTDSISVEDRSKVERIGTFSPPKKKVRPNMCDVVKVGIFEVVLFVRTLPSFSGFHVFFFQIGEPCQFEIQLMECCAFPLLWTCGHSCYPIFRNGWDVQVLGKILQVFNDLGDVYKKHEVKPLLPKIDVDGTTLTQKPFKLNGIISRLFMIGPSITTFCERSIQTHDETWRLRQWLRVKMWN